MSNQTVAATRARRDPGVPPRPGRRSPVVAVAAWSARHRTLAIAGWLAFVVAGVVLSGLAGTRAMDPAANGTGEAGRADRVGSAADFGVKPTELVLVQARSGVLDRPVADAAVAALRTRLSALSQVAGVGSAQPSADGRSLLVPVTLAVAGTSEQQATSARTAVVPVLAATAAVQQAYPGLRVEQAGNASLNRALDAAMGGDFHRAELFSIPLTLVILVLVFGSLVAASVPVALALTSIVAALGLSGLASHLVPQSELLSSVVLLIGMAVGVDYSLFVIRRVREERAQGAATVDAVDIAAATAGRAVVVSGLTVAVAMTGLYLSGLAIFQSMGVGTILVVLVAVLGSMTVLPAVVASLGRRLNALRVPVLHRYVGGERESRVWAGVLRVVLARPAVATVVAGGALVALALPALGMHTGFPTMADYPTSIPAVGAYDRIVSAFPGEGGSHTVVIAAPAGAAALSAGTRAAVSTLVDRAARTPGFAAVPVPVPAVSSDGRVIVVDLPITDRPQSSGANHSLQVLRTQLLPATVAAVPGVWAGVTGQTAENVDYSAGIWSRMPLVVGVVLALTVLVMLVAFRSWRVALLTVGLNLLSVGAAYGLLVLVFQHGVGQGLLGFRSNGLVVVWLPLFLFVVLFGLSMDYHVFVVSRIREYARAGLPVRDAVRRGVVATAGVVTAAAVIMIAVFSVFGTLSGLEFKQMGIGMAAAILIDATVIRGVLLPATLALLGERAFGGAPAVANHPAHFAAGTHPAEVEAVTGT